METRIAELRDAAGIKRAALAARINSQNYDFILGRLRADIQRFYRTLWPTFAHINPQSRFSLVQVKRTKKGPSPPAGGEGST